MICCSESVRGVPDGCETLEIDRVQVQCWTPYVKFEGSHVSEDGCDVERARLSDLFIYMYMSDNNYRWRSAYVVQMVVWKDW